MSQTESLISAIRSFDVDTVEKLLKSDLEIDNRNRKLHSILHTTIKLIDPLKMQPAHFNEKANEHLNPSYSPEALRRIVEILLESGRFNVNALTNSSSTALHLIKNCRCWLFNSDRYLAMVNAIIELLLKNNADINAKNSDGRTPLMRASQYGCSHIVQLLLDWRDEHDAGVDINARDKWGETALFKAATFARVDIIELLLQHGCFDKFYDNRRSSALHAVIYGAGAISKVSSDFLALIEVLAAEKTSGLLYRYAVHSRTAKLIYGEWTRNDSIQETISMLVTRGQADINLLDLRSNTVLDVALKSKLRISQKTIEILKEYGASSTQSEYPDNTLRYTDKLGKTPLHRLSAVLPELTLREKVEIFDFNHLLNNSPRKELLAALTVAKDHRGRTILHHAVMPTDKSLSSDDILTLMNVLKLESSINKRDNYRRTPLHYCDDEDVYSSLIEIGANETLQDIDGNTPRDLKKLRTEEHDRYNLPVKSEEKLNQETFNAWMIWNDSEYAYRDPFSEQLCDKVQEFINKLSDGIGKMDPRFECRPVLVGSAEEGTKIGLPDEFDFNFILTKLSEVCEVVPSPEAPSGYVHLRRTYNRPNAKYWPENECFRSQEDFDRFFNSGGFLLTQEIANMFKLLYLQVMSEQDLWEAADLFEWDQKNEGGMIYVKCENDYADSDDVLLETHPCSTIQLKLNRPIEGRYMFTLISIDIVPCIKINGWWPEETLSGVDDEIKVGGCHLVFDEPQRRYPWVPFSDPFARISFAPAESRIIRECSAVARAAYMVGKQLLLYYDKSKLTYVLKTGLLYCIEAFKDITRNVLLYEDIKPSELILFVEKLMRCVYEFCLQDFLPCYLMPSFHMPIEDYLKSNHDQLLYDSSFDYPLFAYELYSKVCTSESLVDFCSPTPEPLNEAFEREELIRRLSMDRSFIAIYRRVFSESLAT